MTAPPRLLHIEAFIAEFRAKREARREARLAAMDAFLSTFEATHRRVWRTRVDFNVFSLLGVRWDEVCHSAVLAWLLGAQSGHGQGDLFMRAFAELCRLDIPDQALDRYHVRTEFVGEESIIDVMVVCRGEFLVYLENKVYAAEGPDQLSREFRDMRRLAYALRVPAERQFAILLTPYGRAPLTGDETQWRTVSYAEMAAAFEAVVPSVTCDRVRHLLEDWIETISIIGGSNGLVV